MIEQKLLFEKEKMLVTCILSFYHNLFRRLLSQGLEKWGLYGKLLTYFWRKNRLHIGQSRSKIRLQIMCSQILDLHCLQKVTESGLATKCSKSILVISLFDVMTLEPCFVKKWFSVSAKSIDPCQLGQTTLADKGQNLPFVKFPVCQKTILPPDFVVC